MFNLNWEKIGENTLRLKVFRGWIVRHSYSSNWGEFGYESSVFVPDEEHEWTPKNDS